jgi:hypothetical protein
MNKTGQTTRTNFYRKNPLHVYILNSKTQKYDKIYVIINSPPPNVMRAVKAQTKYKSVLNEYFGPSWKKLLNPSFINPAIGGAPDSKNLFSAFTDTRPNRGESEDESSSENSDKVVYVDYSVYPEDSIETIKNKLYVVSGIAPYRQHININNVSPYKFILQDNLIIPSFTTKNVLYGVSIDKNLELYHNTIKILSYEHETLESFTPNPRTLEESVERVRSPVHYIELVDFNVTFKDVIAKPGLIDDQYQFDLLYYGAAIAFWPQLSREAFKIAISSPDSMTSQFPFLSPSLDILVKRFAIEKQLIDKTYEYANNPPKVYRVSSRPFSAISYTYVSNSESMPSGINLRNVFDLFILDKSVCVSRLYFKPSAESNYKNIVKKHILAPEDIVKRVYEKAIKRPSVLIATETTTLTIQDDSISFEQIWKEDTRIDYKDAILDAEKRANKFISTINDMKVAAFPIGNSIPIGKHDKIIRSNIAAFWPRVLTTNGFAEFKRVVQYYNGSIYEIRSSGTGSIILMFKKGMTDFDIPRLIRFYSHLKDDELIEFINTYSYLTNSIAFKRWSTYYSGKIVRIYHKTSEIKIEALDVTIEEFEIVKVYFFTMLDLFISKSMQGIIRLQKKTEPQYEKFLQRLREHDPELYDLRRHDKNANVYSIICQSGRQPFIYGDYDLKKVSQSRIRNLVKYWNFTENKPAYYECPYKEYPHLGFRSNEHPLGYCLPCCQKLSAVPGSKQELINNLCLKEHKISEESEAKIEEVEGMTEEIARHAVQYGKLISHGRIGECPALIANGLFYNSVAKPYFISLIGVRQHLPGTQDAGFFFSLCYILNIFSDKLVNEFKEVIKHLGESFYTLGQGEANKFDSADQLIVALHETLITGEQFTAFTQDVSLIPILIDLVYIRFGISLVLIVDNRTSSTSRISYEGINVNSQSERTKSVSISDFVLHTTSTSNSQIITNPKSLELAIIFKTETGYYPFAIINKRMYSKYSELTRRTFRTHYDDLAGDVKPIPDSIAETVIDVLRSYQEKSMSLATVKEFANAYHTKYKILHKLIGVNDTCYGVIFVHSSEKGPRGKDSTSKDSSAKKIYIPINNSPHHVDGIPAVYGVRNHNNELVTRLELMNVISDFNKFLNNNGYTEITPVADIIDSEHRIVGFISEGLYYYHSAEKHLRGKDLGSDEKSSVSKNTVETKAGKNDNKMDVVYHPYDTADIDRAIFKYHGKPQPLDTNLNNLASTELYDDYLYKLLLLEFAAILQGERNEQLRKDLIQIIRKTNFHDGKSLTILSESITKKLEKYPGDQKTIKVAITEREDDAISYINNNVFEFDSLIIQDLRNLSNGHMNDYKTIIKKLDNLLKDKVQFAKPKGIELDNIFISSQKLVIEKEKYNTFLEIMAQDVTNQLKNPSTFLVASGVQNPMKFIIRKTERLYVT